MVVLNKSMTIGFYFVFLFDLIIEIVFLFEIPYYYFSMPLQILKIMRILLGIINILIDLYFLVIKYAEYLIKKAENEEELSFRSNHYRLSDKILIIIAFLNSSIVLIFNIFGIALNSKYLKRDPSSFLSNCLYVDSLLFLLENILVSLCWIYFVIFWAYNIQYLMTKSNVNKKKNVKNDAPPGPSQNQVPSSERNVY